MVAIDFNKEYVCDLFCDALELINLFDRSRADLDNVNEYDFGTSDFKKLVFVFNALGAEIDKIESRDDENWEFVEFYFNIAERYFKIRNVFNNKK